MKPKDLKQALKALIACVAHVGMEYPEAHWYVIDKFNLTRKEGEILTKMYDECGGVMP